MKATYRVLAILVPILVALQASFIALGFFGIGSWVHDGHPLTKHVMDHGGAQGEIGLALHGFGAMATALVALLLLIVSFFAKIEGGVRAAALVFADVVVQWVLAFVSYSVWVVGLLHGLNAFLLFGLGMMAAGAATRSMKGAPSASPLASTV